MRAQLSWGLVVFVGWCWMGGVWAAAPGGTGKVTEVTLYQGQAQVTRTLDVAGKKGTMEFVVSALPERIVSDSLYAEGSGGLLVRAVRYRVRRVQRAPRKQVRVIDEKLEALKEKLRINGQDRDIARARLQYLKKLESFVAPSARAGLMKGSFEPEKLIKMSSYLFEKRARTIREISEHQKTRQRLLAKRQLLVHERRTLTSGGAYFLREAVVFLEKTDPKPQRLRLIYQVTGCGWSPVYQVRGDSKNNSIQLEYNVLIQQQSGEDWENVKLRLSTAEHNLSATAPGLAPFKVKLSRGSVRLRLQEELLRRYQAIQRGRRWAERRYNGVKSLRGNESTGWLLNSNTQNGQLLELNYAGSTLKWLHRQTKGSKEPTLDYKLHKAVSLSSRTQRQMLRIMQHQLKAHFYYLATPVLSNFVHREAEIVNKSPHALLKGPVTVYLDHRFVGRSEIPTIAVGETFQLGFGADPRLRTSRKLVKKTSARQGGNQILSFVYGLKISNYTSKSMSIRVFDRVPYFDPASDVSLEITSTGLPLSTDKSYLRTERPLGILRWNATIPAKSHGEKSEIIEYSYNMTFDRKFHLVRASGQKEKQTFFRLQQRRWKR